MKIIFLILAIFIVSSCRGQIFSESNPIAPKPFQMGGPDRENADPIYLSGWDDGCNTGLSTMNHGYYKSFYAFKQDPYMARNPMYYKAWKDAYTYCRQYSFRFIWDSLDKQREDKNLCILCPQQQ